MIIPAAVIKIIGFKEKQSDTEIKKEATETSNIILAQIDNGKLIHIKIFSNDKNFSNSLKDFLISKTNSVVKESEIKQTVYDLTFDSTEKYKKYINLYKEQIKNENPTINEKKLQQEAAKKLAQQLVFKKRQITQKSIIKLPIAIGISNKGGEYYNSRSIQVTTTDKGEKIFGRGGIYYFAQTMNNIPIEITPIRNKEGNFVGFFKITTAKLINSNQINFLIDHSIRTINELIKNNKKPFLIQFIKNDSKTTPPNELLNLFKKINQIEKQNRESANPLNQDIYITYIETLNKIKELMINKKSLYRFFKVSLPLILTEDLMKKAIFEVDSEKGKSSIQKMAQAIVSLNFSKENPDIKKNILSMINTYISKIPTGENSVKILTNINFQAPDIFGYAETWGFPSNNIDFSKFTLSYNDTYSLIKNSYSYVEQLKNQKTSF
jgi:hypothetical protein